jgi:hypothetical protein
LVVLFFGFGLFSFGIFGFGLFGFDIWVPVSVSHIRQFGPPAMATVNLKNWPLRVHTALICDVAGIGIKSKQILRIRFEGLNIEP